MPPMNFSFLTPLAPRTWVPLRGGPGVGGGGRGGCQNFFAYSGCCAWIWTQVRGNFFLVHGPPNPWWWSRVQTPGTPGCPPNGPLLVRTLPFSRWIRLFSDTYKISKTPLFRKPFCRP